MEINKKLTRNDLVNFGRWVQPTLPGTFWCHWYSSPAIKPLGMGFKFQQCIFLDGNSILFKEDTTKIETIIQKLFNKSTAKKYTSALSQAGQYYETLHLELLNSDQDYKKYVPKLFATYNNLVGLWWFTIPLADALEAEIKKRWPAVTDDVLFEIMRPSQPTWLEIQNQEIRRLAKIRKSKKFKTEVAKHVSKFRWFGTHHWGGDGYSVSKCLQDIKAILNKKGKEKSKVHSKVPIPIDLINLARAINYWRTHCAELTSKVVFESRSVLTHLAKDWRLTYDDLTYLSHQEILKFLKNNQTPKGIKSSLQERKIAYGCYLEPKNVENIVVGSKLRGLLKQLVDYKIEKTRQITGTVASKGKMIIGQAKIIISPKDFSKFKKGDILVATETTPDFVPLMKIALAIITDRGGITSHAAIVSRELGTPSIVGTNIATKVFKDGDLIEVDANKGIVRKL